ncbi:9115_t:CDS:2 [Ambispora leptoticha]|uniref:9115_t:CDS:1 n=1 Tax=Ambispora leptoticha TaxID=144679 RepID=A0A9N9FCT2_9GLOM|nr:9115_t:CDS:2 [Ambispora leptoticha]
MPHGHENASNPISPSKLRQIAPALSKKSDYDIYHIPRGYEVLLVPKEDTVANPDIADVGSPISSTKPIIIPLPKSAQSQNNSSWRKRKSNDHIPRPKNCFMAYREHIQHEILQDNPGMNNKLVSVIAAQKWNEESEEVKETWREKAKQLKAEHQLKYPNYKFSPKKKPGKTVTGGRIQKSSKTRASANSKVVGLRKSNLTTESTMHDESAVVIGSPNLFHGNVDNSFWGHYRTPSGESSEWTTTSETSSNNSPSFEASSPGSFSPPTFQVPEFTRSTSPLRFERPPQYQSDTSTSPTINHFNLLETFDPYPP